MNKTVGMGISLIITVLLNLSLITGVGEVADEDQAENLVTPGLGSLIMPGGDGENEEDASQRTGMEAPANLAAVTDAVGDVSLTLFQKSVAEDIKDGKNVMVSPVSILSATAMAEAGALGKTLDEMEDAFGCSKGDLQKWMKAWRKSLKEGKKTKINVANSFWYRQSFAPDPAYLKTLKNCFGASANASLFDQETVDDINAWCKKNTFDMIPKIIDSLSAEQEAMLVNAVAFEGKWKEPYEDWQIAEKTFTTEDGKEQPATMLCGEEKTYIHDKKATGFVKPYQDGYSFVAILPKEGVSVSDYLAGLDGDGFRKLLASKEKARVITEIPEFQSEYDAKGLIKVLKQMGIKQAFDEGNADFSAMGKSSAGKLFISDMIHKTFIEVNREGTRAAAVTGIICGVTSVQPPETVYEVYLDRPFLYAIIDDGTKTPIFMGAVMSLDE